MNRGKEKVIEVNEVNDEKIKNKRKILVNY